MWVLFQYFSPKISNYSTQVNKRPTLLSILCNRSNFAEHLQFTMGPTLLPTPSSWEYCQLVTLKKFRGEKFFFLPYLGLVTLLNYKVVSAMAVITRRHNSIATIKRLSNITRYFTQLPLSFFVVETFKTKQNFYQVSWITQLWMMPSHLTYC